MAVLFIEVGVEGSFLLSGELLFYLHVLFSSALLSIDHWVHLLLCVYDLSEPLWDFPKIGLSQYLLLDIFQVASVLDLELDGFDLGDQVVKFMLLVSQSFPIKPSLGYDLVDLVREVDIGKIRAFIVLIVDVFSQGDKQVEEMALEEIKLQYIPVLVCLDDSALRVDMWVKSEIHFFFADDDVWCVVLDEAVDEVGKGGEMGLERLDEDLETAGEHLHGHWSEMGEVGSALY